MNRLLRAAAICSVALFVHLPPCAAKAPSWARAALADEAGLKGKGHAAVLLYENYSVRYTSLDRVVKSRRQVYRIFEESGRSAGHCAITFNADSEKVREAKAWILDAKGREIESYGIHHFMQRNTQMNGFFWNQQKTVLLDKRDEVPLGGVFIWEIETESMQGIFDVRWTPDTEYPVLQSRVEVVAPAGGELLWRSFGGEMPKPVPGVEKGALLWELRNLQGQKGRPPEGFVHEPLSLHVRSRAREGSGVSLPSWGELARQTATIIEPKIESNSALREKALTLTAGKTGAWDRIRALCRFVQKEIGYLSITLDKDYLAGYRPHPAGEVLKDRLGDCKDKATLLAALVRELGYDARVVLVYSGNPRALAADWPSAHFNHAIAAIRCAEAFPESWPQIQADAGEAYVLFDPTEPIVPLGLLPERDQAGFGLLVSKATREISRLPAGSPGHHGVDAETLAEMAVDGGLKLAVTEIYSGNAASAQYQQRIVGRQDQFLKDLEARIQESLPTAKLAGWSDHFEEEKSRWTLKLQIEVKRPLRTIAGGLTLVSTRFLEETAGLPPWDTNRSGTFWVHGEHHAAKTRLRVPENWSLESLPDNVEIKVPEGVFSMHYSKDAGAIVLESKFEQTEAFLEKSQYENLRRLVQKMQETERRPLVFKSRQ